MYGLVEFAMVKEIFSILLNRDDTQQSSSAVDAPVIQESSASKPEITTVKPTKRAYPAHITAFEEC